MDRFKITIIVCLMMALVVPLTDFFAVSPGTPLYTHFLYCFGHDGYLHFVINAWSLLVMHNLFRWYRVLAAYAVAVIISFFLLPDKPMVGASVFTCFFFGFTAPWLWRKERAMLLLTIALLLLTCILPGFAGIPHVTAYAVGFVFSLSEAFIRKILSYLKS